MTDLVDRTAQAIAAAERFGDRAQAIAALRIALDHAAYLCDWEEGLFDNSEAAGAKTCRWLAKLIRSHRPAQGPPSPAPE